MRGSDSSVNYISPMLYCELWCSDFNDIESVVLDTEVYVPILNRTLSELCAKVDCKMATIIILLWEAVCDTGICLRISPLH